MNTRTIFVFAQPILSKTYLFLQQHKTFLGMCQKQILKTNLLVRMIFIEYVQGAGTLHRCNVGALHVQRDILCSGTHQAYKVHVVIN